MEMSTLGTTTLLVDLAQLVEQGEVKEFEKKGRDVLEKGTVALSESLIVASSDTLETYRTNTTRCTNDSCSAMIEEERDDEDEEATSSGRATAKAEAPVAYCRQVLKDAKIKVPEGFDELTITSLQPPSGF